MVATANDQMMMSPNCQPTFLRIQLLYEIASEQTPFGTMFDLAIPSDHHKTIISG